MSAAGSYPRWNVNRRSAAPSDAPPITDRSARSSTPSKDVDAGGATDSSTTPGDPRLVFADRVDLSSLSIAGISRRHVTWVVAGLLATWIVIVFARQVSDATAAAAKAAQLAEDNAALAAEVNSLQAEANLIVKPVYVAVEARRHGLGAANEIPFSLSAAVPAPVDGAPGSASVRLGSERMRLTPLESWLSLLFGPGT
jgi:cell division protein FtsB